jgi:molybdopterin molybdotransferase
MDWPYRTRNLRLARKITSVIGRVDYVRVLIREGLIEPLATSGASILSSTTRADGFVLVPRDSEGFAAGEEIQVFLYD